MKHKATAKLKRDAHHEPRFSDLRYAQVLALLLASALIVLMVTACAGPLQAGFMLANTVANAPAEIAAADDDAATVKSNDDGSSSKTSRSTRVHTVGSLGKALRASLFGNLGQDASAGAVVSSEGSQDASILEQSIKTPDNASFDVSLAYDAGAKLPANAKLEVIQVVKTPEDYDADDPAWAGRPDDAENFADAEQMKRFEEKLAEHLSLKDENIESAFYLIIRITADGEQVQPAAPVMIAVQTDALKAAEGTATRGVLLEGKGAALELDALDVKKGDAFSFEANELGAFGFANVAATSTAEDAGAGEGETDNPGAPTGASDGEASPKAEKDGGASDAEDAGDDAGADSAANAGGAAPAEVAADEGGSASAGSPLRTIIEQNIAEGRTATSDSRVTFTLEASSDKARPTLQQQLDSREGGAYRVRVIYDMDASIPTGSKLLVRELEHDESEAARTGAQDVLGTDVGYLRAFDITIVDANGVEVEPAVPVDVQITLEDAPAAGDLSIVHFDTAATEVIEPTVKTEEDASTLRFEAYAFSVYAVAGTVARRAPAEAGENAASEADTAGVPWPEGMVSKELTSFNGNLATYKIVVNPEGKILNNGYPLTLQDTFSDNQSIIYSTIKISSTQGVSYDFSGQTGTYEIPDGERVEIAYTTRVMGKIGEASKFGNTAVVGVTKEGTFVAGAQAKLEDTRTITPTGTDITGTGGVYSIDLFVYAQGHMEGGLEGAVFRMLDSNKRPMYYKAGDRKDEPIMFETKANGYVPITLSDEEDGLSIHKNTVYYLEMVSAPYQFENGEYTYYQKDDTFYSFLITDDPDYTYGGVYSYFNGDVLKVRCYPEAGGVNVTKRFSGNYALSDEQKNGIIFTLQQEKLDVDGNWVDVEEHRYADFSYGSINFNTGSAAGRELADTATYRVRESNARPADLPESVEVKTSVTLSYQKEGKPVQDETDEFSVDPDDKDAFSYDFAFTNEYVDHKLSVISIDEDSGNTLSGSQFSVYAADDASSAIATYTAGEDGSISIHFNDEGAGFVNGKLYYVQETRAPENYLLPDDPEKTYFYFSQDGSGVPGGLPSGETATDLTASYDTITVAHRSETVDVPVTVTWGLQADVEWPEEVGKVVVGLYKSVGGAAPQKVLAQGGEPRTVELTKEQFYSTAFKGLPAREEGKDVVYSVVEEEVLSADGTSIMSKFSPSSSISGTGWYVVNNQEAVSVVVEKKWYALDGSEISDASQKPAVTFDLYRMTKELAGGEVTRSELLAFLSDAVRVRTGVGLSNESGWSIEVSSLQSTDKQGTPYYYYVVENVPDNHEDTYSIQAAAGSEPRTLTVKNRQTPTTVVVTVADQHKTYGDEDREFEVTAEVKDPLAHISQPAKGEDGTYRAFVTSNASDVTEITFTVSREEGEDAGTYPITFEGKESQGAYRVVFESGTLTIGKAPATITAGAEKVYGEKDPLLVSVEGLKRDDTPKDLEFVAEREEGEDVGEYTITLTGSANQKNYTVTFVRSTNNAPNTFKITSAPVVVKAQDAGKTYGEDDPEFTAKVTGLKFSDESTVINYDLTRTEGEDIGEYVITPQGSAEQGNYSVTYETAKFAISPAELTIRVEDAEKMYGDEDPEWDVRIDGLPGSEDGGTLSSELDAQTGTRTYSYTTGEDAAPALFTFTVSRDQSENAGGYDLVPSGDAEQKNYKLAFVSGVLSILPAELTVTADRVMKSVSLVEDPQLTATVSGWRNGDDDYVLASAQGTGDKAGYITWTYKRADAQEADAALLTFTLHREPGTGEGEYQIFAEGDTRQSNYVIEYEPGLFEILAVLDVDVTQPVVDYADADASPSYTYTATLDLTATGLASYEENGFELVDGVPTLTFTLPAEDKANMKTLKVPGSAKLTVRQHEENADYTTAISVNKAPYTSPDGSSLCTIERVDTYHEIAFTHSRISLPVSARAAEGQTEDGAKVLAGRQGAMGIPDGERAIDEDFADEMYSKINYELPTDKYYAYDHASLYDAAGAAIEGASNVTAISYVASSRTWEYKTSEDFAQVPDGAQLVLFYLPKYVCKIGAEKFYSIVDAVSYANGNGKTATIEMLIGDYAIRSKADAVTIPSDCDITITTAQTEYEGTGQAVISRSANYASGHMFTNKGKLTFDNVVLDGKNVAATDAIVLNENQSAELAVSQSATMRNAKGDNGGAVYVKSGTAKIDGTLSGNSATSGGAVYVAAGTVNLDGTLSGNSATSGGAVYVAAGTVNLDGTLSGNSATSGGAVYVAAGEVSLTGTLSENNATAGGALNVQGGTVTVDEGGKLAGNSATTGGALHIAKGTVVVNGTVENNTAANGAALYKTDGTLALGATGKLSGNKASASGGAVFQTGGTATIAAGSELSSNSAEVNGGAVYLFGGTVTSEGTVSGNHATNGGGFYRAEGTLTVKGSVERNEASGSGGGVYYSTGGTLNVSATMTGNTARNGGGIYVSGATLKLDASKLSANIAEVNGGAVYALNTTTTVGTSTQFADNEATGNGGAYFMEGGSLSVQGASALTGNKATNGGAVYATGGSITLSDGSLTGNAAGTSGGAIYVESASVKISAGTLSENKAEQGNGGAVYSESGEVAVSGGSLQNNSASAGESADAGFGLGGAIYVGSGTASYTGGSMTGNSAVNGAAVFSAAGVVNVSASITGNAATNGGAIGVGSTSAGLYFSGNAHVYDNTMNSAQSNVYLSVDSESVVNATGLASGKTIGIYVPGEMESDLVVKRGDNTGYFGAYTNENNVDSVFKNDRIPTLMAQHESNRIYWGMALAYDVIYRASFTNNEPPTPGASYDSANSYKTISKNQVFYPRSTDSSIYDMVMSAELYKKYTSQFSNAAGNATKGALSVFAYAYANQATNQRFDADLGFYDYVTNIRWDRNDHKWVYETQSGKTVRDIGRLVIIYSAPAYLSIVNNTEPAMKLTLSDLTVLDRNDADGGLYGYVTARNGATAETMETIKPEDLVLEAGQSVKLLFPGAGGQTFTLSGTFTGDDAGSATVKYKVTGAAEKTLTAGSQSEDGLNFTLPANECKLTNDATTLEVQFGDNLPICKIGDVTFATLNSAMEYAKAQKAETGNKQYTIEMMVDYLQPNSDRLAIPDDYDITITTASKTGTHPYTGAGERATLSRDVGNTGGPMISSSSGTYTGDKYKSKLTVENLIFDGRDLGGTGNGGAVSTKNAVTKIENCLFKGFAATNGGAIYVDFATETQDDLTAYYSEGALTVKNSEFDDCTSSSDKDKTGGGAIWTKANKMIIDSCTFASCACVIKNAQGGAIFQYITSKYSLNSESVLRSCSFEDCFVRGAAAGAIETEARITVAEDCSFIGCYSDNRNGGAFNLWADGDEHSTAETTATFTRCYFRDCHNPTNGGAIRSCTRDLKIEDCKFDGCYGGTGGAIAMTNNNARKLEIFGSTFTGCYATGNGGSISAPTPDVTIGKTNGGTFKDGTSNTGRTCFINSYAKQGGAINHTKTGTFDISDVDFDYCRATSSPGGGIFTNSTALSIKGESNTFKDCTAWGSGGAVYQDRNVTGSAVSLENCEFDGCIAYNGGKGGGVCATALDVTISGAENAFRNCEAASTGGGLYLPSAGTVRIANCAFESCIARAATGGGLHSAAQSLYISGDSTFESCTAQTHGGGLYHDRNVAGSVFSCTDVSFENCTAAGDYGGAIRTAAKIVTLKGCSVANSTSKTRGGGVWLDSPTSGLIEGCSITGNSATDSASTGGGVFINGGTTVFVDSIVRDCSAVNGGGMYLAAGTLHINGGAIAGTASNNGGGLYVNNATVNHRGGTVAGVAAANGGAVYKGNGTYNLGDESEYDGVVYTGASIGGLLTLDPSDNGADSAETLTSSAVNGGAVYNAGGTLYVRAGGSIGSEAVDAAGNAVYTARATANGGGVYLSSGAIRLYGGVITNCEAASNGGGIYHASTGNANDVFFYADDPSAKIQNCRAENGGGIYLNSNTLNMGETNKTSVGVVENCHAESDGGGVYVAGGTFKLRNASAISGCTAGSNGGGVYMAGSSFESYNPSVISGCTAGANGGGVYMAAGMYTFYGGKIIRSLAAEAGGGIYHADGTFSMSNGGAVVGGSEEAANTANVGAGIFVANGKKAIFNDNSAKTLEISYNHALVEGGGIAVGGPDTVLVFQNKVTVRNNTMGSNNVECNVYLDQDRNTVITNNALDASSYIGVYASDAQDAGHGEAGMPFATQSNANNLNVYHNDRRRYLYGYKGDGNLVKWVDFVCKITDGNRNLLYKDAEGSPAAYPVLETAADGAFNVLNVAGTPVLYTRDDDGNYVPYTASEYHVEMLVQSYSLTNTRVELQNGGERKVTLTTAPAEPDECDLRYVGDARFNATLLRTSTSGGSMVYVNNTGHELAFENITLDGGEQSIGATGALLKVENSAVATLENGAVLQNGKTNNQAGGAVYVAANGQFVMNAGSTIKNCSSGTADGGGIYVAKGTFTMNGGSITGCSAKNGGGVCLSNDSGGAKARVQGGEISGNNATVAGGGVAFAGPNARIYFSGYSTVMGNTLKDSTPCNVQLGSDTNAIINANGLDGRSEIGIYTDGLETNNSSIYFKHGMSTRFFGTYVQDEDKFYCFVNDRDARLRGVKGQGDERCIMWEGRPLLRVEKTVTSDLSKDKDQEFTFVVQLSTTFSGSNNVYGDMTFNSNGTATVKLKDGESATASLPESFYDEHVTYTVTERPTAAQEADFSTWAHKDASDEHEGSTLEGTLGENLSTDYATSTALSVASFNNVRVTGSLSVSKKVTSDEAADMDGNFDFELTLADSSIDKVYGTVKKDGANNEASGQIEVSGGVAHFTLKHGETLSILELPTDLEYTVREVLTGTQGTHTRQLVSKNGSEPSYAPNQEGIIGERATTQTIEGKEVEVYSSTVEFENVFLDIVCKIVNRSRALLYFRDASGTLQPAIYSHLEDAFAQVNEGNLRTSTNGSVSGALRIEMVVREYAMEGQAVLDSGKTVVLSTALPTDDDNYPYNDGQDDGMGNTAVVSRGFDGASMIADNGSLTIDKIVLDGAADAEDPHMASADGGIVNVASAVRLTVNNAAELRNSTTSGKGGAIRLGNGASLVMNGAIRDCSALQGGGVYADAGFTTITSDGVIAGCKAVGGPGMPGNGGAVYASTGTSVNLNAGTRFTENHAANDGGAVYSDASVILRGSIGAGSANGNSAERNGGGLYMGSGAMFTMYSGSAVSGNKALNGGGLAAESTVRIAGGTLDHNSATEDGGAVHVSETATLAVSGTPSMASNTAKRGGAVYDGGTATMSSGEMTGNYAAATGGAVYVADASTFTMSGGGISGGNASPQGAVSTGEHSILVFSGNAVVNGNTGTAEAGAGAVETMNVYLGYDSNSIITTPGLGASASIGVYVADGEPEDKAVRDDAVDNPIYCDHGLSARNFGTYTGSSVNGARLDKFVNDRDVSLTGMGGAKIPETGKNYVAWIGKGLQLKVSMINDYDTNETVAAGDVSFALTNTESGVRVWSGKSGEDGLVSIPWGAEERANGSAAVFAPKSAYTLVQTAANEDTVRPAGWWTVTIGRDNSVTWETVPSSEEHVDRTRAITALGAGYLGETFGLINDKQPTLTYDAAGGKLSDNSSKRTDTVDFDAAEVNHEYTIEEPNPTQESHVFRYWSTSPSDTGDNLRYERDDKIVFYRGTDSDVNALGSSRGDITLYAHWDAVVCKITDRDGTLLYVDGSPAVYGTLEAGFKAFNEAKSSTFSYKNGGKATARRIEMLVGEYTLDAQVELARSKTVLLTTAPRTDKDGYAYTGAAGSVCVITRGPTYEGSMIVNKSNLTLTNITLDGGGKAVVCDGGILRNDSNSTSAVLAISKGTTLRNSIVDGRGGAVYVPANTSASFTGGIIEANKVVGSGEGAGIYVEQGGTLNLSGSPQFSDNLGPELEGALNGGEPYPQARQDIYLAGAAEEGAALKSIVLTGNLSDSVKAGSIWVWAAGDDNAQPNHYYMLKQFAVLDRDFSGSVSDATYNAFRNARADADTDCGGEYLTGQAGDDIGSVRCVYWTGGYDFSFVKVDGFGKSLAGATFALYTRYASPSSNTPYRKAGEDVTATSSDGSDAQRFPDPDDSSRVQDKGTVLFPKIAPKTYYMVETNTPDDFVEAKKMLYRVTVAPNGDAAIERKALADDDGKYEPAHKVGGQYQIMNVSKDERKTILKKYDDGNSIALKGAEFDVYRYDMTKMALSSKLLTASDENGVFFVGDLPLGVYYLQEKTAPNDDEYDYADNEGKWFCVRVDSTGVKMSSGYKDEESAAANRQKAFEEVNPKKEDTGTDA